MQGVGFEEFASAEFLGTWNRILQAMPVYDIGQTHQWCRCWWQAYLDQGPWRKNWFVLAYEKEGQIEGIAPLQIRQRFGIRIVEFLGQSGGFMTDYCALVVSAQHRRPLIRQLLQFLLDRDREWDLLSLAMPAWTGELPDWVSELCMPNATGRLSWAVEVQSFYAALDLPADFDDYLSGLGKKTRAHARQYLRKAERVGAALRLYNDAASENIAALYALNRENWSVFEDQQNRAFIDSVVRTLEGPDQGLVLGIFSADGSPRAAFQGFHCGKMFFLHTAGVARRQAGGLSPGTTMYLLLIQRLIERDFRCFNMGPGPEEYKLRLGARPEPIYRLDLWHRRSRMARWRAFQTARRAWYALRPPGRAKTK